jgi:hypothetical protein
MPQSDQQFDEIRVYDGIAERTGNIVDRATVRRSKSACTTLSELTRKVRRDGDGIYYLPTDIWPADSQTIDLTSKWTPMS